MYEALIAHLRECAKLDKSNNTYTQAADAIEELSKRLDESIPKADAEIIISEVAKPRWIPVAERLPSIGEKVLVFYHWLGEENYSIAFDMMGITHPDAQCPHWLGKRNGRISHWMPLPEPPKEETK